MSDAKRAFASLDDLVVRRDAAGQLVPLEVETPLHKKRIRMLPISLGEAQTYESQAIPITEWPPEEKARLILEHIVEPDLSGLTVEDLLAQMPNIVSDDLALALTVYGGLMELGSGANGDDPEGKARARKRHAGKAKPT